MVLMGANNLLEQGQESDLSTYAEDDLKEMEMVGKQMVGPLKSVLKIVVQLEEKGRSTRYLVDQAGRNLLEEKSGLDAGASGDPAVLTDFLRWAKTSFPADRYMLVLWGHAYQLAFGRDPNNQDGLSFPDLAWVLEDTNDGRKLDIVAFDSCNQSLIEGAYQLRTTADFMVASQFTDPLPGWPYHRILERVLTDRKHLAEDDGPKDFGRAIVSQFVRNYSDTHDLSQLKSVTMTMLDLRHADEIHNGIADLARSVLASVDDDAAELDRIDDAFQRSQVAPDQPSVDLATLCWNLANATDNEDVRRTAVALGNAILRSTDSPTAPFVVAHGKNDLATAMLQGVSIFAPNVERDSGFDWSSLRPAYERLDLTDTLWDELVFNLI
jgi:hypothetical protein